MSYCRHAVMSSCRYASGAGQQQGSMQPIVVHTWLGTQEQYSNAPGRLLHEEPLELRNNVTHMEYLVHGMHARQHIRQAEFTHAVGNG